MIKNTVFDWSGVIKDAVKSHSWVVNKMFKELGGKEISMDEMKENWKQPYMHFYNKYLPNLTIEEEQKAYKEAILHKDCPDSNAYPGIVDFIKKLKNVGFFLALITSDLPETFVSEIEKYDLKDVFDEVVVNAYDKTESLKDLIKKYSLDPKKTFFIGDSNHEIEAAKEAKCKSIAVTWGFSTRERLGKENPDFTVDSIEELEKILLK